MDVPGFASALTTGGGLVLNGDPLGILRAFDADTGKAAELRKEAGDRDDVFIYSEDCNKVLLKEVFPRADYSRYKRALCLLDPYDINLTWDVIEAAGKAKSIEIFVNFMIMDINRNALRKRVEELLLQVDRGGIAMVASNAQRD